MVGISRWCYVPPKKKGEEPRFFFTTVRGAPQNGDGRIRDHAPDRLSRIAQFVFFQTCRQKFQKTRKMHKKKRVTRNRLVYRDDAEGDWASRCRHRENTSRRNAKKTSTASKATLSICLMRTKVVASSTICKSSVVDLVMSRDHQNDNAVWLCRLHKKKSEAKKGTEQSAFEPTTTRSKVSGLPPRLSRNRRMHAKKTSIESCR